MNELILYSSIIVFLVILLGILCIKVFVSIKNRINKYFYIGLIFTTLAYVILDGLFVVFYNSNVKYYPILFEIVVFLFYIIFETFPVVYCLYLCCFVWKKRNLAIKSMVFIPYIALLILIIINLFVPFIYSVSNDPSSVERYTRLGFFNYFVLINGFYYFIPLISVIYLLFTRRYENKSILIYAVLYSIIPVISLLINAFIIPLSVNIPVQPLCNTIGVIFAYFFITEKEHLKERELLEKQKQEVDVLTNLAYVDILTELPNRRAFTEQLLNDEEKKEIGTIFIMYDVNNLKKLNDKYGHDVGDTIIKKTALLINETFSKIGTSYRIGGDEFFTYIPFNQDVDIQQLIINFKERVKEENKTLTYPLDISLGYALRIDKKTSVGDLLKEADKNMYIDKASYHEKLY